MALNTPSGTEGLVAKWRQSKGKLAWVGPAWHQTTPLPPGETCYGRHPTAQREFLPPPGDCKMKPGEREPDGGDAPHTGGPAAGGDGWRGGDVLPAGVHPGDIPERHRHAGVHRNVFACPPGTFNITYAV